MSLKLNTRALCKTLLRDWRHEPQAGRKHLQNTHLPCVRSVQRTHNPTVRKQAPLVSGQKIWMRLSPRLSGKNYWLNEEPTHICRGNECLVLKLPGEWVWGPQWPALPSRSSGTVSAKPTWRPLVSRWVFLLFTSAAKAASAMTMINAVVTTCWLLRARNAGRWVGTWASILVLIKILLYHLSISICHLSSIEKVICFFCKCPFSSLF